MRTDDLASILHTLLYPIEAQTWHSGPDLGDVAFIYKFFRDSPAEVMGQLALPASTT